MKKIFILIATSLISLTSFSQTKLIEQRDMTWLGYFNQTRFTDKSGLWTDLHWRLNDNFVNETSAILVRVGYMYYLSDKTKLTFGYCFQDQPGHNGATDVLEHRPWQQIQWTEKKSWFSMMQWIRVEQRYRKVGDADFSFLSHRIRYNLALMVPLNRKEIMPKTVFFATNNEVFVNLGKNIVNNYFDQNRFFVGLGYQFTTHLNAQLGYMNVFQQLPAGNKYVNTDAIRLFIFHNLDLRKKEASN
jgi:hypothetical protein